MCSLLSVCHCQCRTHRCDTGELPHVACFRSCVGAGCCALKPRAEWSSGGESEVLRAACCVLCALGFLHCATHLYNAQCIKSTSQSTTQHSTQHTAHSTQHTVQHSTEYSTAQSTTQHTAHIRTSIDLSIDLLLTELCAAVCSPSKSSPGRASRDLSHAVDLSYQSMWDELNSLAKTQQELDTNLSVARSTLLLPEPVLRHTSLTHTTLTVALCSTSKVAPLKVAAGLPLNLNEVRLMMHLIIHSFSGYLSLP